MKFFFFFAECQSIEYTPWVPKRLCSWTDTLSVLMRWANKANTLKAIDKNTVTMGLMMTNKWLQTGREGNFPSLKKNPHLLPCTQPNVCTNCPTRGIQISGPCISSADLKCEFKKKSLPSSWANLKVNITPNPTTHRKAHSRIKI